MRQKNLKLFNFVMLAICVVGVIHAQITLPHSENFDATTFPPAGWTLIDNNSDGINWVRGSAGPMGIGGVHEGAGSAVSQSVQMTVVRNPDNYLVTPPIEVSQGTGVNIQWFASSFFTIFPETYSLMVSTTTPEVEEFTSVFTETLQSDTWQERNYTFTNQTPNNVYFAFRHHDSDQTGLGTGQSYIRIDTITITPAALSYDLVAGSFTGTLLPALDTPTDYTIQVTNNGVLEATNYTISLMMVDDDDDYELVTITGTVLPPGDTDDFTLTWTPPLEGDFYIYAQINFDEDMAIENNISNFLPISVIPNGMTGVYIGDIHSSGYITQIPFPFTFQVGFAQTIYLAEQIGTTGILTQIRYRFNGNNNIPSNVPIKIYANTTEQNTFPAYEGTDPPFLPFEGFVLIYEGPLPLNVIGEHDISIVLDNPFPYNGDNLVLLTHRPIETPQTPYPGNTWQVTNEPNYIPTLFTNHGFLPLDPADEPITSYSLSTSNIPNTAFFFVSGEHGTLSGFVSSQGSPLEGVEIALNGTPRTVLSDVDGNFTFPFIPVGLHTITLSKPMYETLIISGINITAGTVTTLEDTEMLLMHDLNALSLSGATMPSLDQAANFVIRVRNNGGIPATEYSVKLMLISDDTVDIELGSINGMNLAPGQTESFTFSWTPTIEREYLLYGIVLYENDQNLENNLTNILQVNVQPFGVAKDYLGDPSSILHIPHPILSLNLYTSLSQTIYYEDDISTRGAITRLTYRFVGVGDVESLTFIKIYAAITDIEGFTGDTSWININQFTMIYDGPIDLTGIGAQDIEIDLIEPFEYLGGNLAIMVFRPIEFVQYAPGNNWHATNYQDIQRTIRYGDIYTFEIEPTLSGSRGYDVPNLLLTFTTAGTGGLSGVVTHDQNNLAGVNISINDTQRYRVTDNQGSFDFSYIPIGTISITATKHGFITQEIDNIIIEECEVTQLPITLSPIPFVAITGMVRASNTNLPLQGATVSLTGYENYTTTTNAQGQYSFQSVFANEEYSLNIYRTGYITHSSLIEVNAEDHNIPPITLIQRALRPRNVSAVVVEDNVNLTWEAPNENEIWISQTEGTEAIDGAGWGSNAVFTVAHRFTYTQLLNLGVTNGNLTKIAFIPRENTATYSIQAWTGGSDNPLSPGTLVYSGDPIPGTDLIMNDWNEIDLLFPIAIPINAELWIGYEIDTPTGFPAGYDDSPVNDRFANLVYSFGQWTSMLELNSEMPFNFLIKGHTDGAEGRNRLEMNATNSRNFQYYTIFRSLAQDIDDEDTWTLINPNITDTHYTDTTFSQLPLGEYTYILRSVYTNDNISNPAFSNTVLQTYTDESDVSLLPTKNYLHANYPNPFNPSTTISFDLAVESLIKIDIYNIRGQKITTLVNDRFKAGTHSINWEGTDDNGQTISSGIYLYQMKTDDYKSMRKMLLMK